MVVYVVLLFNTTKYKLKRRQGILKQSQRFNSVVSLEFRFIIDIALRLLYVYTDAGETHQEHFCIDVSSLRCLWYCTVFGILAIRWDCSAQLE